MSETDPALIVISLLVAGYVLLALEIFVIPGFGVAGIGGLVCLAAGCYYAFYHYGAGYGALAVALVLSTTTALAIWIPRSRIGRDVVHSSSLSQSRANETKVRLGELGVAASDLRPAGIALFGELRESVVTDGEFLTRGARIRVVEVQGARIVVEPATDDGGNDRLQEAKEAFPKAPATDKMSSKEGDP